MKFTKIFKILIMIILAALLTGALAACGEESEPIYKITFDVNGGQGTNPYTYTDGKSEIVMPADPRRDGYRFDGWFFDLGSPHEYQLNRDTLVTRQINRSTIVYAKWTIIDVSTNPQTPPDEEPEIPIPYNVTFIITSTITSGKVLSGYIEEMDLPTHQVEEHTFGGWYLNPNEESTLLTFPYKLTADIKVYAKWNINKYEISFVKGDDLAMGAPPASLMLAKGETFTLPNNTFTNYNYDFDGWQIVGDGTILQPGDTYTLQNSQSYTLRAIWERLYNVSYDLDDDVSLPQHIISLRTGTSFTINEDFYRNGYVLKGWKHGTDEYPLDHTFIMETGGMVITPLWDRLYEVSFNKTNSNAIGVNPMPIESVAGASITLPECTYTLTNFTFVGWSDGTDVYDPKVDNYTVPNNNIMLYAEWKTNQTYMVTFAGGDGATGNAPSSIEVTPGAAVRMPVNTFSKSYYRFGGWSYDSAVYQANSTNFIMPNENVTFTATWTAETYTITYNTMTGIGNGGNKTSYTVLDAPFDILDITGLVGYVFDGWYSDSNRTIPADTHINTAQPENRVFYAKIDAIDYKIYIDDGLSDDCRYITSPLLTEDVTGLKYLNVTYNSQYATAINAITFATNSGYVSQFWIDKSTGEVFTPSGAWLFTENLHIKRIWSIKGTEGLRFIDNGDKTASVSNYDGNESHVIIPTYYGTNLVTAIASNAFADNNVIRHITIHEHIKSIGSGAFRRSSLLGIDVPSTITSIGANAFNGASSLVYVRFDIKNSLLQSIGDSAFANCGSLIYVRLPKNLLNMAQNVFLNSNNAKIYLHQMYTPSNWNANWNPSDLKVYFGLSQENDYYFIIDKDGLMLVEYVGAATDITIPDEILDVEVKRVGDFTFRNDANIQSIIVPKSVISFEQNALLNNNTKIYFKGSDNLLAGTSFNSFNNIKSIENDGVWLYGITQNDKIVLIEYLGSDTDITLYDAYNGKTISQLSQNAFAQNNVNSVAIDTITTVNWFMEIYGINIYYKNSAPGFDFIKLGGKIIDYNGSDVRLDIGASDSVAVNAFKGHDSLIVYYNAYANLEAGWDNGIMAYDESTVETFGDYKYIVKDGYAVIIDYIGSGTSLDVPHMINGLYVIGINERAFLNSAVEEVTIPKSIFEVSQNAFGVATTINNYDLITISGFEHYIINDEAFITNYTGNLRYVTIPDALAGKTVKGIVGAFKSTSAAGVILKASLNVKFFFNAFSGLDVYVENGARAASWYKNNANIVTNCTFDDTSNFHTVTFGTNTVLYRYENATNLKSLIIAQNITEIADYAFENSGLISVIIDDNGFTACDFIAENAFFGLDGARIYLMRGLNTGEKIANGNYVLYFGLDNAEYVIADDIEYIIYNDYALLAGYLGADGTDLTVLETINQKVITAIGDYAFFNAALNSLTIGVNVQTIYKKALSETTITDKIYLKGALAGKYWQSGWSDGFTLSFSANQIIQGASFRYLELGYNDQLYYDEIYLLEYISLDSNAVIPLNIDGKVVAGASYDLFKGKTHVTSVTFNSCQEFFFEIISGLTSLTEITLPDHVTEIPNDAFNSFTKLRTLNYGSSSINKIGDRAFFGAVNLESITIPNTVTYIGEEAFAGCQKLTTITLPVGIDTIKYGTFKWCLALNNIVATSVTTINDYAFSECRTLANVSFGTVTELGSFAFMNCFNLQSFDLGNVSTINESIFEGCNSLTSVIMSSSVTKIGKAAFKGATNLTNIVGLVKDSVTTIMDSAFENCTKLDLDGIVNTNTAFIGSRAFFGVRNLGTVVIFEDLVEIGQNAFLGAGIDAFDTFGSIMFTEINGDLYNKAGTVLIQAKGDK